jgi:hypothetical protein
MRVQARADDGTPVEVILPDTSPEALQALEAELARRWPPQGLTRVEGATSDDAGVVQRLPLAGPVSDAAWDRLESDLGLFTAERLADRVAVHAALAVVDGAAIVLPGRSFTGKTTLGLALAAAGATLASDEYALVDPVSGLVTGWPRPARIRDGAAGSRRVPLAGAIDPVPVALVAFLRHVEGATLEVSPISRGDAIVAMLDETVCARSRPDLSLDAAMATTHGTLLQGVRGEAAAAATWLLDRLAEAPGARP